MTTWSYIIAFILQDMVMDIMGTGLKLTVGKYKWCRNCGRLGRHWAQLNNSMSLPTGQGGAGGKAMKGLGWPSYGAGNPPEYLVSVDCRISRLPTVICKRTCFKQQVWAWEPPGVWVSLSWLGTKSQAVSESWDTKTVAKTVKTASEQMCLPLLFFLQHMLETATTDMGVNQWEVRQALCVVTIITHLFYRFLLTCVLYWHRIQWGLWQCRFRTRTSLWKRSNEGTTTR